MMDHTIEPCQYLEWDSQFFEQRIARVTGARLDPQLIRSIYDWSESNAISCLYFLADSNDPQTIRLAEDHGFRLVEVRFTLERGLKDWDPETRSHEAPEVMVRFAHPEDIPTLQEIARSSYVDSRFYFDKCFPEEKWQAYYATWVKKSCTGGAELALVAEKDGEVVGYITGLVSKDKPEAQYELTGVKESARRFGVGHELFRSGLDWFAQNGVEYLFVVTQGRNVSTQRMIQRHGFITRSCQLYYHKWFRPCSDKGVG
jgi:dTDP-4-amino-4,6-dideoxy-D-galactose acyltransferase